MGHSGFESMLAGGKRQSIGAADAVAQEVQARPERASELWRAVSSTDRLVRIRAVDALEKVSARLPGVLAGHEGQVLEDLARSSLTEVRWHVGLLVPRLALDTQRAKAAATVLEQLLEDQSRIVQVNALDGIVRLAEAFPELGPMADAALGRATESPHSSVRARARRLTADA